MFEKMNETPNDYSGESNLDESSLHAEIEERLKAFDENESIQNALDLEKAKNNSALKGLLSSIVASLGVALIASPLGTKILERFNNRAELENEALANMPNGVARSVSDLDINQPEGFDIAESLTGYEILDKLIDGSFEQYNNIGCRDYKPEDKPTPNSIGNPKAVIEAMGINWEEATPEQRGAVREYLAYSMAEVAAPIAIGGKFEGFEGKSLEEAVEMIKKMTPKQKTELQNTLQDWFSRTEYSWMIGEGYANIQFIDGGETGYLEDQDVTGRKILVSTTTANMSPMTSAAVGGGGAGNGKLAAPTKTMGSGGGQGGSAGGGPKETIAYTVNECNNDLDFITIDGEKEKIPWGKSGDPESGENRDPSEQVNPSAEVTQKESEKANEGNQGYVDDNHATPGSSSENNSVGEDGFASSGITAEGSNTDEGRLTGGEDQSDGQTAGENIYHPPNDIESGQQVDSGSNYAQGEAQSSGGEEGAGAAVGGDNYSDTTTEQSIVENGGF